ncbi:hypothetical protein P22_0659 [Propionispora sp. 2/2-37]|uniref:sigma 54-interacting transcriptional regulator n=1 Tax=Propionispora sp. 2/2-37 TaxID=1677858 RepID=UPI0006BB8EF8|nr:sigma 54-interacting transcriptional regulator [Propionispora sp. 2/2-37]CUH94593.1 hypothetical protein P22_0659 [Propionispora sp. 2/2-37]
MKEKLHDIVLQENRKEPLTDMELSERLSVSREYVTLLRKELNIADSRERKKKYICEEISNLLASHRHITYRELSQLLKQEGYQVSRYLLDKYLQEVREQTPEHMLRTADNRGALAEAQQEQEQTGYAAFGNLIGINGSLEMQVQQAKAAMLYPPNGLHTLILGETGVGKSEMAEAMYKFAVESKRLSPDSPFIVFNCADYADNAQLLISHLFGSVKGAYTGATSDRKGLVEQAHGGILFLDEVHRLTSEGQEMLFHLMDKGRFRRLGESEFVREVQVQLIAATTENIETNLLATFKRRIPMIIEMPSLRERPLNERLKLIKAFFGYESTRMNAPIHVSMDVMKSFLLYECLGNIGQLKSDIQVICAKSFLAFVMDKDECVNIDVRDLNVHVKKGLMKINSQRQEIDALIWQDFTFSPERNKAADGIENDIYSFSKEFYAYIEKTYSQYLEQGLTTHEISRILGSQIEKKLQNVIKHVKGSLSPISHDEVAKVVGTETIALVEEILKIAEASLGKMDSSIFYCLAIHLNATFNRMKQGREIVNPNLEEIKIKCSEEYAVALAMVDYIKKYYGLELPEDEVGFIALYLHGNKEEDEGKVAVVVVTHGSAGSGMVEIANKLLNVNHGKAVVMNLDENPHEVLERLISVVHTADEGKGVLLLVDMGSLLTFGEMIYERTGITVETVDRVDTVMVIEAIRRSILPGANLRDVVYAIETLNYTFKKTRVSQNLPKRKKAIISLCLTGEGMALHCSRLLKKMLGDKLKEIDLIHMGVIGRRDLYKQIQETMDRYEIVAIIGSIDPKYYGIPYVSMEDLLNNNGKEQIINLLDHGSKFSLISDYHKLIPNVVREAKIIMAPAGKNKQELLRLLCDGIISEGYVNAGYYEAVLERENMGSYVIRQKVALPHADSSYVNHSVVVIAKTPEPIEWDEESSVSIICLLALDINGKDGVRYLYNTFKNDNIVAQLEQAQSEQEIREVLLNEQD